MGRVQRARPTDAPKKPLLVIAKMHDSPSPTLDQTVPRLSAFDVDADADAAKGGTSLASVTDMIIDPFNPSAASGESGVWFFHDPAMLVF